MKSAMQRLVEDWNGLAVVSRFHRPTAAWIFIVLHDDALGAPTGGTRMKVYATPEDGLRDGMRLAEGMTHKWAAIDLDFGGGKAVLALSRELASEERQQLLVVYGRMIAALKGGFSTGQDLGTTPEDMLFLRRYAPYVHGPDAETGSVLEPGPYTARGVFAGIRAAANHLFGSRELHGRRVLVQGVGGVGDPLARLCAEAGATVIVSDVDEVRASRVARDLGSEVLSADAVYSFACDVYAPCAIGATLSRDTIPRLACRVVAGAANNQLAEPRDAERLVERGILYAPDYVINGGGALAFGLKARGEKDEDLIGRRLDGLENTLSEIFAEAADRGESPDRAARRRVDRLLARARGR
jgi:leucine dehydrogenase